MYIHDNKCSIRHVPQPLIDTLSSKTEYLLLNHPGDHMAQAEFMSSLTGHNPDHLIVGSVHEFILHLADHFDRVILPTPMPDEWTRAAVSLIPHDVDPTTWELDIEAFARHARVSKARLAVLTNPCNPTGQLISRKSIERLLILLEGDCHLVVDESWIDFADLGSSVEDMVGLYDLTVLKNLNVSRGCLSLAYLYSDNPGVHISMGTRLAKWNVNRFTEEALKELPKYKVDYEQHWDVVRMQRDMLYTYLKPVVQCWPSQANFVMVKLPEHCPVAQVVAARGLTQHAADHKHLRIRSYTCEENEASALILQSIIKETA